MIIFQIHLENFDIFFSKGEETSKGIFIFSTSKQMKQITFPQLFLLFMLKCRETVIWSNFWRWVKNENTFWDISTFNKYGPGRFISVCHFNLTWKTVHIENIKFEPLDKQFFPIFIGWAKAFCGFSESRLK